MLKCYEENEEIFIRNPNDLLRVRGLQAQLPEVLPRGESSGWTWVVPTKAQDKKGDTRSFNRKPHGRKRLDK